MRLGTRLFQFHPTTEIFNFFLNLGEFATESRKRSIEKKIEFLHGGTGSYVDVIHASRERLEISVSVGETILEISNFGQVRKRRGTGNVLNIFEMAENSASSHLFHDVRFHAVHEGPHRIVEPADGGPDTVRSAQERLLHGFVDFHDRLRFGHPWLRNGFIAHITRKFLSHGRFRHFGTVPRSRYEHAVKKISFFHDGFPVQSGIFPNPLPMRNGEVSGFVNIMGAFVRDCVLCRIRNVHIGRATWHPHSEMRFSKTFQTAVQSVTEHIEPGEVGAAESRLHHFARCRLHR